MFRPSARNCARSLERSAPSLNVVRRIRHAHVGAADLHQNRLENVRAEFSLTALAYNLRRVLNLVGFIELMAALAA